MKNIMSKVGRDDIENARLDRDGAMNPPEADPGMEEFGWDDEPSGGGSLGGNDDWDPTSGGGWDNSSAGGWDNSFGGGSSFGAEPKPSSEDKVFETIGKLGKGSIEFLKELINSFKTLDIQTKVAFGKNSIVTSIVVAVLGLLLGLFGKPVGFNILIGCIVSLGLSVVVFMFSYEDMSNMDTIGGTEEPTTFSGDEEDTDEFDMGFDDEEDDEDESFFNDEDVVDEENSFDDFDFNDIEEGIAVLEENVEGKMEQILDNIPFDLKTVTRQYLYENISGALVNVNKEFDKIREIPEDSEEFDAWDAVVRKCADMLKSGKQDEMPYLIKAEERLFYHSLQISRVKWLKNIDLFVSEIVNICAMDETTYKIDETIYGVGFAVGDKIYIKIMKGETAMVSIKDAYRLISKDIQDSKCKMPIVIGLGAEGEILWRDFKDINSILVTGMPRSGKTWLIQSLLTQMCFYNSPSELQFYILDPKGPISDFKAMLMPHIRKFVSEDADILAELRKIVKVEGVRRQNIIGDAGFVNIDDYKKKNPDAKLPTIYVVVDEVITLGERMDKETKEEFQGLLLELVSRLPAAGIRIFMIPHVVKDNILKKTITDLIPCRVSVRGDSDHIFKSTGTKNFKFRLYHQGDMALRLNNDETTFVHSAVLTPTNEGNQELFEFLRKFWSKLEPDSVKGSLYEQKQNKSKLDSVLGKSSKVDIKVSSKQKPSTENNNKLTKKDMADLLSKVETDEDLDLWGE